MATVPEIKTTVKKLASRESLVLAYVALALLMIHFAANPLNLSIKPLTRFIQQDPYYELKRLLWWVLVNLVFYAIIPMVIIKKFWGAPFSEYGLSKPKKGTWRIYLLFFLMMVPLVALVSFSEAFQHKYPYYRLSPGEALWPAFWIWELVYFLQFAALEFFFRGFMVHSLKKTIGVLSIPVMVVPYVMIHFTKPMPEAIGSLLAGFALGYLSYTKNSVWPGVVLHFGVALTMDLMALWQKGFL